MFQVLRPIFTNELLKDCDEQLYLLLLNVSPNDWVRIAAYGDWTVKDVFSHLVDVSMRRLSSGRDKFWLPLDAPIISYHELVEYIDRLADEWVLATRLVSPRILLELYGKLKDDLYDYLLGCDPFAEGIPVAWAGEDRSANWFDQAREYTEHWIHQQQIRSALSLPPLSGQKHWEAVLDISVRCLPAAYQNVCLSKGTVLGITVTDEVCKEYYLVREESDWKLYTGKDEKTDERYVCTARELCFALSGLSDIKVLTENFAPLKRARAFMTKAL